MVKSQKSSIRYEVLRKLVKINMKSDLFCGNIFRKNEKVQLDYGVKTTFTSLEQI